MSNKAIAAKIIELAKSGERDPDTLCEQALRQIRGPQSRGKNPGHFKRRGLSHGDRAVLVGVMLEVPPAL